MKHHLPGYWNHGKYNGNNYSEEENEPCAAMNSELTEVTVNVTDNGEKGWVVDRGI